MQTSGEEDYVVWYDWAIWIQRASFFCFHATNQFSFILFIFYSIYKVTTQHSWWNVMLASFGTWVRTPGPPSYFHIFLLNAFLCSSFPEVYHAASWSAMPHVPLHPSSGQGSKPMICLSQRSHTPAWKSTRPRVYWARIAGSHLQFGDRTPHWFAFPFFFYIFSIFICFN